MIIWRQVGYHRVTCAILAFESGLHSYLQLVSSGEKIQYHHQTLILVSRKEVAVVFLI